MAQPARINALPRTDLVEHLLGCLNVRRWAEEIADRRPYADADELRRAAAEAARPLTAGEVHAALAAHPRIGERTAAGSRSRSEQSGVDTSDDALTAALHRGNEDYERRFGHVYLVSASGRTGEELLADLRSRLENPPDQELEVVAGELRKIAVLRLEAAL